MERRIGEKQGFVLLMVVGAVSMFPGAARGDGVYRRFEADVTGSWGLGGGVLSGEESPRGALSSELRFRFLNAAGPFVLADWEPGAAPMVSLGAELRPLFPAMVFSGLASGNEWFDLWLQSFGMDLGVDLSEQGGRWGAALLVGASFELPVLLPSQMRAWGADRGLWGQGVFLRVTARHRVMPSRAIAGVPGGRSSWFIGALITLHWAMNTGWVTREP